MRALSEGQRVKFDVQPDARGSKAVNRLFPAVAAPGKSKKIISAARAQARKEGHFSNY